MNILKPFAVWLEKDKKKEREHDYIGEIKDSYFYRLTNKSEGDISLFWKDHYPSTIQAGSTEGYRGISLRYFSWQDPEKNLYEGKAFLSELFNRNMIYFDSLDLEEYTNYIISNRTARQLKLEAVAKNENPIILPPFGTKLINSEILRWYDFLDFQAQDLIRIQRVDQPYKLWDWIALKPLTDRFRKFTANESDVIGRIQDDYYYRVNNKTKEELELASSSKDGLEQKPHILPEFSSPQNMRVFSGVTLNAVGKKKILDLVNSNLVNFQPLDIKVDTNYILSNRTEQRIGIMNYNGKDQLIIPPLGTRLINSDKLKWYNFLEWYWQDLIQIKPQDQGVISAEGFSRTWDWVRLLPGVALVALAGFGIPLWLVYYFGGGVALLKADLLQAFLAGTMSEGDALKLLGRIFQLGFICIASILPALFYYLFGRQQVEKLREKFFRDVLVLDPHLYSLSEAEAKYDTLLNSAFGSGSSTSPFAIVLLIFNTALLVIGWTITLTPYDPIPTGANGVIDFLQITQKPITLGFLGVYFFAINMIYRRYVRSDLTPKTYASIIVRLLVSLVLVFTIGVLNKPSSAEPNSIATVFLAAAFIIGVFPEDGFRFIRDTARKFMGPWAGGGDEKYPITDLEGMNQYDQARLLEEGIENIENLAHHNLIELLAFTRIPTARLVDMIDQAILYLHLGIFSYEEGNDEEPAHKGTKSKKPSGKKNPGKKLLKDLKSLGVRTATDLMEILNEKNIKATEDLIKDFDIKLSHLQTIEATLKDDEWLSFILNWKKEASRDFAFNVPLVTDPNKFYDRDSAIPKAVLGAIDLPNLNFEVVFEKANVRTGPGLEYTVVGELNKGAQFIGTRLHSWNAWVEFEPDKWCPMAFNFKAFIRIVGRGEPANLPISPIDGAVRLPDLSLEIATESLKIRSGPDTECPEVGQLVKGARITGRQLFASRAWIEIGKERWIALTYDGTPYLKFA